MSASFRVMLVAFIFLAGNASASISGPTQSSGTFTLTWSPPGTYTFTRLIEKNSGTTFSGGPLGGSVTLTRTSGIYDYSEEYCVYFAPDNSLWCQEADTHTIVVDPTGAAPNDAVHIITSGDFDSDGVQDIAVIAPFPDEQLVDDFILRGSGGGNFTVFESPSGAQLLSARQAPLLQGEVLVGDATLDFAQDVFLTGMQSIDDFAIWSTYSQQGNSPQNAIRISADVVDFIADTVSGLNDPAFFDNAITTQTITTAGWYVVYVLVVSPGYAYDEFGIWRWFDVGFATIQIYYEVNDTIDVLNPNISPEAYSLSQELDDIGPTKGNVQVAAAIEKILIVLKDVLDVEIGGPEVQPPWSTPKDSPGALPGVTVVLDVLCEALGVYCDPSQSGYDPKRELQIVRDCELSEIEAGINAVLGADGFREPKVNAPTGNDFSITSAQQQISLQGSPAARRSFWQDRLDVSYDPLGPLGLDVVNDEWALGCMANRRYERFAADHGVPNSLNGVGVQIMRRHRDAVNDEVDQGGPFTIGKLGHRQIADYHHTVFGNIGLPPDTFGGTPRSGARWEVVLTGRYWCPSCDKDN